MIAQLDKLIAELASAGLQIRDAGTHWEILIGKDWVPVLVHTGDTTNGWYTDPPDTISIALGPEERPWLLAHEVGHATGEYSRLRRRTLYRLYRTTRSGQRIEETIADMVATALSGHRRTTEEEWFTPITEGTLRYRYCLAQAVRALELLLNSPDSSESSQPEAANF